jgi:Heterokaryon incompatibility protein (HET)
MTASNPSLCARCQVISSSSIRPKVSRVGEGRLVAKFTDTHKQLATSSCTMCRILSSIKPASMDAGQVELRAFSANNQYTAVFARDMKKLGLHDMTLLAFVDADQKEARQKFDKLDLGRTGFLAMEQPQSSESSPVIQPRLICRNKVDYGMIRMWVQYCVEHHKDCLPNSLQSIQALRVIHCRTKTVQTAPKSCRYVALSYVWGKAPTMGDDQINIRLPRVVEDAVTVCSALGFDYLWVDRYVRLSSVPCV